MTRRAIKRTLAVASALALHVGLDAPASADCLPAADLSGDADVAQEVARALSRLGVVHGEMDGACPPVAATVLADQAGIAVTVRDARGRIEGRVVADARTAAAWIESWVHDDAASLWSAPVVVAAADPLPEPVPPSAVAPVGDEAATEAAAPGRHRSRWLPSVAVHLGRDLASDGSNWDGIGGSACERLGRFFCVGVAARHVRNGAFSNTGGLTQFDRSATVIAATAAARFDVARAVIAPELAIGAGWLTTERHEPSEPCVSADGTMCADPPLYIGDGFAARTVTPRLGAAVSLAVPLTSWLSLDGRLGVEVAPGAHTTPHRHDQETDPVDPNMVPVPPGDPLLDLPAEPGWTWIAAVGLRVEIR